jgi:hypothetical protein
MMKAQVSIEYIMVLVTLLSIALPAGFLFYQYSENSQDQIKYSQLETFGKALVLNAAKVYFMGDPSRITVSSRLPDNVVNISYVVDWSKNINQIVFVTRGNNGKLSEIVFSSKININGSFYSKDFVGGLKPILLEAYRKEDGTSFVFTTFSGRCPSSTTYDLNNDCLVDDGDREIITNPAYCFGQQRTMGVWNDKWSTCIKADYNGDCIITEEDADFWDKDHGQTDVCPDVPVEACDNDFVKDPGENCANCHSDVPCNTGYVCDSTESCVPCGAPDQPCCGKSPYCNIGICISGKCPSDCGTLNKACCSGSCYETGTTCDSGINKCVSCGGVGKKCCAGLLCDLGTCTGGYCPASCGAIGEDCCSGTDCNLGAVCSGTKCVACGALNQDCCSDGSCNGGFGCSSSKKCVVCGTAAGQPCCNDACTGTNIICSSKVPSLIGYYSFDDGTAKDSSAYANTLGVLHDVIPVAGKEGKAFLFNGTGYIDLGNIFGLHPKAPRTIEAWIKNNSLQETLCPPKPCNNGILSKAKDLSRDFSWQLRFGSPANAFLGFQVNDAGLAAEMLGEKWADVGKAIPNGWNHVAAVYDGYSIKTYLNGVAGTATVVSSVVNFPINLLVGDDGWNNRFNGSIDEVKIYNRSLSQTEIQADMVASSGHKCIVCGTLGNTCCAGNACNSGYTCSGGLCANACGSLGQSCCQNQTACRDGVSVCFQNKCVACGAAGQPCCPGEKCSGSNVCWNNAPGSGLEAYYKFDEESGTTIIDSANGHNGILNGIGCTELNCNTSGGQFHTGSGRVLDSHSGNALRFDGNHAYVDLGHIPPLGTGLSINGSLTIETWLKTNDTSKVEETIISPTGSSYTRNYHLELWYGMPAFEYGWQKPLSTTFATPLTVNNNSWIHLALVSNYPNLTFYINGNYINSRTLDHDINATKPDGEKIYIGAVDPEAVPNYPDTFMNGSLDNLKIWRRALSDSEIRAEFRDNYTCVPNPTTLTGSTGLYTNWNSNIVDQDILYGSNWQAQNFTVFVTHTVTKVRLPLLRIGNFTGSMIVSIRATGTTGKPTGPDLAIGSIPVSSIAEAHWSSTNWYDFDLGAGVKLVSGKNYALVFRAPTGGSGTMIYYWIDPANGYKRGSLFDSTNSGSTWIALPAWDAGFQEYGYV